MNRNTEAHFAQLPSANIGRSKFDRSFTHKTTFNTGELVPVYVDADIVPGDTVTMRQSELIRMMTPIAPVMDNSYLDFYWFFVPDRLVMNDFKKMMGENETAPWTQTTDVTIPQVKINNNNQQSSKLTSTVLKGSVLNHMGIPISTWNYAAAGTANSREIQISTLAPRAYCLVWNEFFRDENLQNPVQVLKDNTSSVIINENYANYISNPEAVITAYAQRGGLPCLKVCKPRDYFSSALPGMQKGPSVALPLSTDFAPVIYDNMYKLDAGQSTNYLPNGKSDKGQAYVRSLTNSGSTTNTWQDLYDVTTGSNPKYTFEGLQPTSVTDDDVYSLAVDLTKATGATVTALRQAFAIQKFYERDARGGTRYIESVKSHFGVTNPDFRLQRPEYLGGFRQNINMNQVVQNSPLVENVTSTPLGTTGAYSVTSHQNGDVFTHSFTEHGILLGLCCVRTDHTYQQGINRAWFKKKRLDFYSPEFANLSEQAILNQEIYADGSSSDTEAFGYQEAWAEMRYMPDMQTGEISGNYGQTLQYWTYADYYSERPSLGNKWIQETDVNMARTLAIQDHDQFIADFYFGAIYTRPMPLYSIPGLIDHH